MPGIISPISRNPRPLLHILLFLALTALPCLKQQTLCAQEPPPPKPHLNQKLLGPFFTFSEQHKRLFAENSKREGRMRRRLHPIQLQEYGVNRDGSVWWHPIFLKNYCAWYQNNQQIAQLTVGEIMQTKRQQKERAALLLPAGPPHPRSDFEHKQDGQQEPDQQESASPDPNLKKGGEQEYTPEQKSSLWLECLRALLMCFFDQKSSLHPL